MSDARTPYCVWMRSLIGYSTSRLGAEVMTGHFIRCAPGIFNNEFRTICDSEKKMFPEKMCTSGKSALRKISQKTICDLLIIPAWNLKFKLIEMNLVCM